MISLDNIGQVIHIGVEALGSVALILGILLGPQHIATQKVAAAASKAKELETIGETLVRTVARKNGITPDEVQPAAHGINGVNLIDYLADAKKVSKDVAERVIIAAQQKLSP